MKIKTDAKIDVTPPSPPSYTALVSGPYRDYVALKAELASLPAPEPAPQEDES